MHGLGREAAGHAVNWRGLCPLYHHAREDWETIAPTTHHVEDRAKVVAGVVFSIFSIMPHRRDPRVRITSLVVQAACLYIVYLLQKAPMGAVHLVAVCTMITNGGGVGRESKSGSCCERCSSRLETYKTGCHRYQGCLPPTPSHAIQDLTMGIRPLMPIVMI